VRQVGEGESVVRFDSRKRREVTQFGLIFPILTILFLGSVFGVDLLERCVQAPGGRLRGCSAGEPRLGGGKRVIFVTRLLAVNPIRSGGVVSGF